MDEVRLGSRTLQPRRQLLVAGRREPLGKRALDILSVLAEARGEIVTKEELLEAVWPGVVVEENALQVHVVALRKALGPEADRLRTIRGVGYQLAVDTDPAASPAAGGTPASSEFEPGASPVAQAEPVTELRQSTRVAGIIRSWVGAHRWAVIAVGVLALLAGAWAIFGSDLGLRSSERIPVVVRALTTSGTGERAEAALASGITDELIFRLRRIPELRIATAAQDGTVPGGAFINAYFIDGTIRSSGDRLRIAVRLADANGEILWSDTLDRGVSDLFDMQEEIAAAISGALSVSFDVGADSAQYGGTNDPEAYAAYMQYYAHQWDPDPSEPQRYLERAVAIDPHFVKGLFGLAQNFAVRSGNAATAAEAEAMLNAMDDSSRRAHEADPDLALGPMIRGFYLLMRRDVAAADKLMQRATDLDRGNDPHFLNNAAIYEIYTGRVKKGASIRQSNELIDPIYRNDPWKIFDFMMLGRYRDSVDLYAKIKRSGQPTLAAFPFHAFSSYLLLGDEAAALKFAEQENMSTLEVQAIQATPALATMSEAELRRWADRFPSQTHKALGAVMMAYRGCDRQAVQTLRLAFETPGSSAMLMLWHPALARARRTPEFARLVDDLGLVKAWRASGDWGDYCRPVSATEITCT